MYQNRRLRDCVLYTRVKRAGVNGRPTMTSSVFGIKLSMPDTVQVSQLSLQMRRLHRHDDCRNELSAHTANAPRARLRPRSWPRRSISAGDTHGCVRVDKDIAPHVTNIQPRQAMSAVVGADQPLSPLYMADQQHHVMTTHRGIARMCLHWRKQPCPIPGLPKSLVFQAEKACKPAAAIGVRTTSGPVSDHAVDGIAVGIDHSGGNVRMPASTSRRSRTTPRPMPIGAASVGATGHDPFRFSRGSKRPKRENQ